MKYQGKLVTLISAIFCSLSIHAVDLAQAPLYAGVQVNSNLALVPSVEFPTVMSRANLNLDLTGGQRRAYFQNRDYFGYFDSGFCYEYVDHETESERHFRPVATTTNNRCTGANQWSGNFLSWATTQTIDAFRLVMTGGYRVRDTLTETWVEKARHTGSYFPDETLQNTNIISGATPYSATSLTVSVNNRGNVLRVTHNDSSQTSPRDFAVRVKVCDHNFLEDFCVQYGSNYKPEGLLQEYAESMRFSVFGYLNDDAEDRDGGVLRAEKKYIGPRMLVDGEWVANPRREWNPETGIQIRNPDNVTEALGITIADSGVLNYLNKFGQLNTNSFKSLDPVSELYYAAYRYLSGMAEVPEYSSVGSANANSRTRWADNFPVIENWLSLPDPIQHWCQPNFILGIGDVYTHRDKNLPGNTQFRSGEPSAPAAVTADNTVNVVTETNRVGLLEGIGNIGSTNSFTGRSNSAYMAGLAYRARTRDIRPEGSATSSRRAGLPGIQTIATHWVDVMENQLLEPMQRNQFALTAKYGGFRVPTGFDPENPNPALIEQHHWHTNGQTLIPNSGAAFLRPDNYYLAGQATVMRDSLRNAFRNIQREARGSASSVAVNSPRFDAGSQAFLSTYVSGVWRGELAAYSILPSGSLADTPTWTVSGWLDGLTDAEVMDQSVRNLLTAPENDGQIELVAFNLGSGLSITNDLIRYVRGDRQTEEQHGGAYRDRQSRLHSIVNSTPAYASPRNFGYASLSGAEGSSYLAYVSTKQSRPRMVYIGSNGGKLHAFNAQTGVEAWAYIPRFFLDELGDLADPEKSHRYFVDGSPLVTDAYLDGEWRTLLIGTVGAGGKGIFALDVTAPEDPKFLWELTGDEVGEGISTVSLVRDPNGWRVLAGNAYNSDGDLARFLVINAETGSIVQAIALPGENNGLGPVAATSSARNQVADLSFGGDLHGNLWRFSFDSTAAQWTVDQHGGSPVPLFARAGQPITSAPELAYSQNNELMIFFGTGKFIEESDKFDSSLQSFYGIKNAPLTDGASLTVATLVKQSIIAETSIDGRPYRVVTDETVPSTSNGWYMDLNHPNERGERVVFRPTIAGANVIFSTLIPSDDICAAGGTGWLMAVNRDTGGRRDVFLGIDDQPITVTIGTNGSQVEVPVSGIGFDTGAPTRPSTDSSGSMIVGDTSGGKEIMHIDQGGAGRSGRISWRETAGD